MLIGIGPETGTNMELSSGDKLIDLHSPVRVFLLTDGILHIKMVISNDCPLYLQSTCSASGFTQVIVTY